MRGSHSLRVQSAHLRYDMLFKRNLTIIQGDSATGKTTLVDMIQEYLLNGSDTGISLVCDCPCRVVSGNTWKEQLAVIDESIVFIDEGNRFISSEEFAQTIKGTGNYYVIVTREALDNLPYSVAEIYGIKSSGKYGTLEPVYHEMFRIYPNQLAFSNRTEIVLTEDSNAGYEFFSDLSREAGIACRSANGVGNVFSLLQELDGKAFITVVADGAAFGPQMARVYRLMQRSGNRIRLYLPESFEWLILCSDVLDDKEVRQMLKRPGDSIESSKYFSWERYFTAILVEKSRGTWLQYSKRKLNPSYLKGMCRKKILDVLPHALFQGDADGMDSENQ